MNQNEIMEMAREASSMARLPWNGEWIFRSKKELMAFAALVAAKEREACAKVCDRVAQDAALSNRRRCDADALARSIRARGQKEGA